VRAVLRPAKARPVGDGATIVRFIDGLDEEATIVRFIDGLDEEASSANSGVVADVGRSALVEASAKGRREAPRTNACGA
jgi:hypothetical protein